MAMASSLITFSLLIIILILSPVASHSSSLTSFSKTPSSSSSSSSNNSPLSPKASLLRYWARKVPNKRPHPSFFTSKLSPLSPLELTTFSDLLLTSPLSLSSHLPSFCSSAHLLCSNSITSSPSLSSNSHNNNNSPSGFTAYVDSNFTNYASNGHSVSVVSSFANYSEGQNVPTDTFRRYSRNSISDNDTFSSYSVDGNVVTANFTSYGGGALGDTGEFTAYHTGSNVPDLKFTNYDDAATGAVKGFKGYAENTNAGEESFAGYGKKNKFDVSTFTSYGNNSNVIGSGFNGYGEGASIASDSFESYGENGNVPENNFSSYGDTAVFHKVGFENYRNQSNVGDDTFTSYGKKASGETATFGNYGKSFNEGSDTFQSYGEDTTTDTFNFTSYSGEITEFKKYYNNLKERGGNQFSFTSYVNASTVPHSHGDEATEVEEMKAKKMKRDSFVNKWVVEPGKFFRESSLKKGTVMPMPDIRDKMPPRSFLPRSIASKIPFSADKVREVFQIREDTAMGKAVADTISECERVPSKGETKRCGRSAEDIIDFAVSVLGSDTVVRSTDNTKGSGGSIMIGDVKGINGGKVTRSVSCHQSLFPYLVYYCHSVPKVRVYEADILDVNTKEKINHGVAICHIDTSDWSAGHGAFIALGSAPGKIEVCHWIFEGDMTWATAD